MSMGPEWGMPPGLKCPPADAAFGSEQSPFSWMWRPCVPGGAFSMWTWTLTPPVESSVNVAVPVAVESLRGSMVALALGPSAGAGVDDAQPDRARAAAAENVQAE